MGVGLDLVALVTRFHKNLKNFRHQILLQNWPQRGRLRLLMLFHSVWQTNLAETDLYETS